MRGRVHAVGWDGDRLTVTGEAYINSVSMRRRWTSVKAMTLRSAGRKIIARARQVPAPGKRSGWSGFEFAFDVSRLRDHGRWVEGVWTVEASVLNAGVFRRGPLRGGSSGSGAHPPYRYVADGVRVVPRIDDGRLVIEVERVAAAAVALSWDGDTLVVEVKADEAPDGLSLTLGDDRVDVPVTASGDRYVARVAPEALEGSPLPPEEIDDTRDWTVRVAGRPLVLAEEVEDVRRAFGPLEVAAGRGPGGYLRVRRTTARLSVDGCAWEPDGTLVLTAAHPRTAEARSCCAADGTARSTRSTSSPTRCRASCTGGCRSRPCRASRASCRCVPAAGTCCSAPRASGR